MPSNLLVTKPAPRTGTVAVNTTVDGIEHPMRRELDKLVDDAVALASEISNAFRALDDGRDELAGRHLTGVVKSLPGLSSRAQIILWEIGKSGRKSRRRIPRLLGG